MSIRARRSPASARFYRVAGVRPWAAVAAAGALAAAVTGCGQDAARNNLRAPGDEFDPALVLDGPRGGEASRGMAGATAGVAARPLAASKSPRWSDVEMAIRNVAEASFVGVRAVERADGRIAATTVLEDGQVGSVVATRDASGAIAFDCRLSTFPDAARDGAFAKALGAEMQRLAAVPRPVTR
jgi:hypothetical protein